MGVTKLQTFTLQPPSHLAFGTLGNCGENELLTGYSEDAWPVPFPATPKEPTNGSAMFWKLQLGSFGEMVGGFPPKFRDEMRDTISGGFLLGEYVRVLPETKTARQAPERLVGGEMIRLQIWGPKGPFSGAVAVSFREGMVQMKVATL